ncbi:MAG: T9SS type A sorting domain-containing protein [Bacteroidetes bacterium]|nr:T9SS type A sorting domain-containing protein [Bacteroidota bacterium]
MISLFPCVSPAVTQSNPIVITVVSTMASSVSIHSDSTHICEGSPVNFQAVAINGGISPVYEWKINGLAVGTNNPVYLSNVFNNNDQVSCEMTSSFPCAFPAVAASNTISLAVDSLITPVVTIASSPDTSCTGMPISFVPVALNGGSLPIFDWFVNNVPSGTTNGSFVSSVLLPLDQVYCVLHSNDRCLSTPSVNSNTVAVNFFVPVIPVVIESSSILYSSPAVQYQWYFNSSPIPGAESQSYFPVTNGFYQVETTDTNGCVAMSSIQQFIVGTGMIKEEEPDLMLFPNPTNSDASLMISNRLVYAIDILNVDGKSIVNLFKGETLADHWILKIHSIYLSDGIYFIRILESNGVQMIPLLIHK